MSDRAIHIKAFNATTNLASIHDDKTGLIPKKDIPTIAVDMSSGVTGLDLNLEHIKNDEPDRKVRITIHATSNRIMIKLYGDKQTEPDHVQVYHFPKKLDKDTNDVL